MKKSTKAVMLSALIFPGVGQLSLKRYAIGFSLVGAALVSLYFIMSYAVESALSIADKIQRGDIPLDTLSITELVSQQSTGGGAQSLNVAWLVIIASWLISVVHAYIVGRSHDEKTT